MSKITLTNNKGETVEVDGNTTMPQLIAMGYKHVFIVPVSTPLPDGYWQASPSPHPAVSELIDGC